MELMELYFKSLTVSENTMKSYKQDLEKFEHYLNKNNLTIETATVTDLQCYDDFLRNEYGFKATTRITLVNAVKRMYKYLVEVAKVLEVNPTRIMKKPKRPKRLPKNLNVDEIQMLYSTIDKEPSEYLRIRNRLIIEMFIHTGLRVQEMTDLQLDDFKHSNSKGYTIVNIIGKGDKEREIPLTNNITKLLEEYLSIRKSESAKLIVTESGKPISKRAIQKMVKGYLVKANLDEYSTHSLRHTTGTLLVENGVDIRIVQEILGHEDISTTQIYASIGANTKHGALNELESALSI